MAKRKTQGKAGTAATAEPSLLDQIKGVLSTEAIGSDAEMLFREMLEAVRDHLEAAPAVAVTVDVAALEARIAELSAGRGCAKCGGHDHAGADPCGCACHVPIESRYTALEEAIEAAIALPRAAVVDLASARALIKSRMDDLSGILR